VYRDPKLESEDLIQHRDLYGEFVPGVTMQDENAFLNLREHKLSKFTLAAAFTRFTELRGLGAGLVAVEGSQFNAKSNHLAGDNGDMVPTEEAHPEWRGMRFSVNAISEEQNPPLGASDFNSLFEYSLAHELGHALIWSLHSGHPTPSPGLMSDWSPSPVSLGPVTIQTSEVGIVTPRRRLSMIPTN
jgi:hypothetical protein